MRENEHESATTQENKNENDSEDRPSKYGYGVRHIQSILIFFCLTLAYGARGHLGVTVVAMTTNSSHIDKHVFSNKGISLLENDTNVNRTEGINGLFNNSNKHLIIKENVTATGIYRTYQWPKSTQEMVFGSFFLGYCVMMLPMGLVSQRWGGKILLQIAMVVNGILSFFTPWLLVWGDWKVLCVVRVLQGLSQAGIYPAISTLLSNWVPISERATFSSYIYTGSGVGTIIAFQLGGILAYSKFGWPSTFWVTGVTCLIGFIIITFFGAASPVEHKSITKEEKNFILGTVKNDINIRARVPWKSIFTSLPVWSAIITYTGNATCFVYVFIQLPSYMHWVLKLDIRNSGLLSSLPYIASIFSSIAFGVASDYLTDRKIIKLKNARILCNSVASVVPAIGLILVSYTTNIILATICLIMCTAGNAATHSGCMVNYIDLSPNYSGALIAIGNAMTNFVVLGLPIIISYIVTDVTNQLQWRITMFLMAGLSLGCNIIFVLFMSSDVQPWNNSEDIINKELEVINLEFQENEIFTDDAKT